jgi:membrane-associated protein
MDALMPLVDFVLHIDQHLALFVSTHGVWAYALLFAVIFVETGVVVMPFLPGDSLLFIVGALSAGGVLDLPLAMAVMFGAAVAGNQCNYQIGRLVGPRVFHWEQSKWFNKRGFDKAHAFYEQYGGITLIVGRFMPFVRTFAPFVAGVTFMTRRRFTFYDVTGGALWIGSVTLLGFFIGNIPWVHDNQGLIGIAMIVIPGIIALVGLLRSKTKRSKGPPATV